MLTDVIGISCRKSFRKAQITAKHNLQEAQRREREILYASFSYPPRSSASSPGLATPTTANTTATEPFPRRRKHPMSSEMSKEDQMISTSHDVTQSMRRTHDMMAAELAKSDFAHNTLRESTDALAQLSENYSNLDAMLSNSRALLGTLLKSQKSDTWYLRSAFYLLVVTVGWLIFRRLLWGPTWWLVWLPLKLVFRTAVGVSNTVGGRSPVQSQLQLDAAAGAAVSHQQPAVYMNNEGVPTIQAADDNIPQPPVASQQAAEQQESNLVMEHIAKIIAEDEEKNGPLPLGDDSDPDSESEEVVWENNNNNNNNNNKGETILREREPWELPNPKKRMMEGPPGNQYQQNQQQQERVRDEL